MLVQPIRLTIADFEGLDKQVRRMASDLIKLRKSIKFEEIKEWDTVLSVLTSHSIRASGRNPSTD
jgi:hypothetical protein